MVPSLRKDATKIVIRPSVPALAWPQIFTDGSITDAEKVGGAGILIKLPSGHEESFPSKRDYIALTQSQVLSPFKPVIYPGFRRFPMK